MAGATQTEATTTTLSPWQTLCIVSIPTVKTIFEEQLCVPHLPDFLHAHQYWSVCFPIYRVSQL